MNGNLPKYGSRWLSACLLGLIRSREVTQSRNCLTHLDTRTKGNQKEGKSAKKRGKPDNVVGNRKGGNQEISGNQNQHESTACPNIAVLATNWPASARAKELVSSTGESAEWAALDLE
jgi:hypothetical protein